MKRIAVIGSGISGMSAAYFLSRCHEVYLFEKDSRLGGHTNTLMVEGRNGPLPVDTGFIVHNDRTYPNLVRLFRELGVETQPSDMSFSVLCHKTGFEYSSRGLPGFFAQPKNLRLPSHYELLAEILRFSREAPKLLREAYPPTPTLGEYLDEHRYSSVFTDRYIYPMASAVWSTSLENIRSFPATTLIRFFDNHGMLQITRQPKWKILKGGSYRYIVPLTAPYRTRIQLNANIRSVRRNEQGIFLTFFDRPEMQFDEVVFACHGDQVLPLLELPTDAEREIFGCFKTSRNEAWLHTDTSVLPVRAQARASWNYNLYGEDSEGATLCSRNKSKNEGIKFSVKLIRLLRRNVRSLQLTNQVWPASRNVIPNVVVFRWQVSPISPVPSNRNQHAAAPLNGPCE